MGFRSSGSERFSYVRGLICLLFSGLSPGFVFVCLSVKYSRYSLPWQSVLRTTSSQLRLRCSFPPLFPKCKQLLNHSVLMSAWGEWIPMTPFLKSRSISSWSRLAASLSLFPLPSLFSSFCFDFNASRVLANELLVHTLRQTFSVPIAEICSGRYPIWLVTDLQVFDSLSPSRETRKPTFSLFVNSFCFCVFVFFKVKKIFYVCICMQNESLSHS